MTDKSQKFAPVCQRPSDFAKIRNCFRFVKAKVGMFGEVEFRMVELPFLLCSVLFGGD